MTVSIISLSPLSNATKSREELELALDAEQGQTKIMGTV